jgi:hypothetical protein
MAGGTCLCEAVRWAALGPLQYPHACHCTICRKTHGTAYGAYVTVRVASFRWLGGREHVQSYTSSKRGRRWFCGRCGSVVPDLEPDQDRLGVPMGSLEDAPAGLAIEGHIFAGTVVPWTRITDGMPQHEFWPPGFDFPVEPTPVRAPTSPGRIGGSCLCDEIAYDVEPPLLEMRHCHCLRCRRARGAPHATNAICLVPQFRYTRGEALLRSWKVPEAARFTQTFCSRCGSPMPGTWAGRDRVVIPAGSFDDDPVLRPQEHIFVGSKASWFAITDGLPQHRERG